VLGALQKREEKVALSEGGKRIHMRRKNEKGSGYSLSGGRCRIDPRRKNPGKPKASDGSEAQPSRKDGGKRNVERATALNRNERSEGLPW